MSSRRSVAPRWLLAVAVVAWPVASPAEEKPLWEAGLGIGAMVFPDYRGSDQVNAYPIPLPYFGAPKKSSSTGSSPKNRKSTSSVAGNTTCASCK